MLAQIKIMTGVQLKNMHGIKFYFLLVLIEAFYIGGMTYGYVHIGLEEIVPAYLIMLSSLIILFFSIFKAGSVIFQKNAYDILASLPISQTAIVVSRFIRMYVENLILVFGMMIPFMVVYGIMVRSHISFYIIGMIVAVFIPCIPITIAVFVGALITAIASKMRRKSLVTTGLSILLFLGIMLGASRAAVIEDEFSVEMMQELLMSILSVIENIYPPAVFLGSAMLTGDFGLCILCMAGGVFLLVIVIAIVSANFHWICRGLYSTSAKHNYQMENLKKVSVLKALYMREMKRYFASSVYVTNTIISPVMAVLFSIAVLTMGMEQMQATLDIPINIKGMIPYILAGIFCIMPTTCTSISMEGKEWWIVKSLPVKAKDIFDSKILLNLSLLLPFLLVSEILLVLALKPNIVELLWLIVIPVIMVLFGCVFGITVNLKMPVFEWENEVTVVKQSASALIGGIGGFLIVLLCMVPNILVPAVYDNIVKLFISIMIFVVTVLMYKKNNQVDLQEL